MIEVGFTPALAGDHFWDLWERINGHDRWENEGGAVAERP